MYHHPLHAEMKFCIFFSMYLSCTKYVGVAMTCVPKIGMSLKFQEMTEPSLLDKSHLNEIIENNAFVLNKIATLNREIMI